MQVGDEEQAFAQDASASITSTDSMTTSSTGTS
jgi:hypothetical protein